MTKIITQKQLIKYKIKYLRNLFIGNMLKYYVNIVRKIKCIYPQKILNNYNSEYNL